LQPKTLTSRLYRVNWPQSSDGVTARRKGPRKRSSGLLRSWLGLLARMSGPPPQTETPASVPEESENADFEEVLAALRLEFEGEIL
jgi:hypothetical protein